MKKLVLMLLAASMFAGSSCKKTSDAPSTTPRTDVPAELRGNWMYGNFSMTEYWSQNPEDYLGYGFEVAFAFTFNADGSYDQYFTSKTVSGGVTTYQQSVTKGTVEVNTVANTLKTHPNTAHYRRTSNGNVVEERDLAPGELSASAYTYTTGTEPGGTKALYLTLEGTQDPYTFLKK